MELMSIPGTLSYSITTDGKVWSAKGKGRWLQPVDVKGYKAYNLREGTRYNPYPACRLILETYIGPCPPWNAMLSQER